MKKSILPRYLLALSVVFIVLSVSVLFISCAIEEADLVPLGALTITAYDTSNNIEIIESDILIDGNIQVGRQLPATFTGYEQGEYEITLQPGFGYRAQTRTVSVSPPDTSLTVFEFDAPDTSEANNGRVRITVEPETEGVAIIINESFYPNMNIPDYAPVDLLITPGSYSFSVFKEAYRTLTPALYDTIISNIDTLNFSFTLEAGTYGNTPGLMAPDFEFPTDLGDTLSLGQYRGRLVLLTWWFYDCEPCRHEFPIINEVYEDRFADGFRVLAINTGWVEIGPDDSNFLAFRDELNLTLPILINTYGENFAFVDYGFLTAPTNFIINASGEIVDRRGQYSDAQELNDLIDLYLP